MKQYIITAVAVVSATAIYAQDINKTDANGKRTGAWIGYYEKTNNIKYEGTFKDGVEVGMFKFYADSPEKKVMATKEFKADGSVYAVFYNGKKKMTEGVYINKKKEGVWKIYHINGTSVMTEEPYKNDKLHGVKKVYYISGALSEEIEYNNGVEDGKSIQYAENGVKIKETSYKNGTLHGKLIIRDADGKITDENEYVNGILIKDKNQKK
jgi:antitoxin component YwqK of YwqJK toxin-antitoxin module